MSSEKKLKDFDPIFYPGSIAIVGASKTPGKIGGLIFRNFLAAGFRGDIYPVNPAGGSIQGIKIYPNIRVINGPIDNVISAIPSRHISDLIDDCAAKGVKVIQIFSAGFSETGKEKDIRMERDLTERARNAGIRIIGPNCVGVSCPAHRTPVLTTGGRGDAGSIAFLSQSGGHIETLTDIGVDRGIRFSKLISFGNGCDLNELDFLDYLTADPESQVVGVYLENGRNARVIIQLIRQMAKRKPAIVWKGGETSVGRQIAASHTGSLAGSGILWEAAIKQVGAIKVSSLEELADTFLAFQNLHPLERNRAGTFLQKTKQELNPLSRVLAQSCATPLIWESLADPLMF